jgi:hypothetical protein
MITGGCTAIAAATISFAASSQASPFAEQFQSPSGDIACTLVASPPIDQHSVAKNFVQCDIANHSWVAPQPPPQGRTDVTSTFVLVRGQAPVVGYSSGAFVAAGPTLDSAQAPYGGVITCTSEQSGVKCTDTSTGHFFRVSRESYELG